MIAGAVADIFDALVATTADTVLDADLDELLWAAVSIFHRAVERVARKLDDNEQAQRRSLREQDGSEVGSVQLEQLLAIGHVLLKRRDSLETFHDCAVENFRQLTGSPWAPRSGSRVNHRHLTAAVIDSCDFIAAKRRTDTEVHLFHLPTGTRIAFTGGQDCTDHLRIWAVLERVHAKHADIVLLHGGAPKGAERIAACWADSRKVAQITFKPDWTRHAKAAPFKRNDQLLETLPVGLIVFPGSGISDNLADKVRKLGIPLIDFRGKGGA